jgi:hypothetical protein
LVYGAKDCNAKNTTNSTEKAGDGCDDSNANDYVGEYMKLRVKVL